MSNISKNSLLLRIDALPPAFKNSKSIFRKKDGTRFIATNPTLKKRMQGFTRDLKSQLLFMSQTIVDGTPMECSRECLIALLTHCTEFDDSIQWIPEVSIKVVYCDKGNDHTEIEIEQIEP